MSVNKAILLGRLGADPELRFTPSGQAVCSMRLATNSVRKDKDGNRQEHTEWHRVTVWGQTGENCSKYLSKGREVYVEGEIRTRQYDDKQGVTRWATEVVARDVKFLGGGQGGGRRDDGMAPAPDGPPAGFGDSTGGGDDDVPF